ncbi:MAG: hypothetical protein WCT20_04310, partial [Candidatus Babeliales bacterium]
QPVKLSEGLELVVGFTGQSVQSSSVIVQLEAFKQRVPGQYMALMDELENATQVFIQALQSCDQKNVFEACQAINVLFRRLEDESGILCMTDKLERLIRLAGAYGIGTKQSGAAGGDCGIAFCSQPSLADRLKEDWRKNGIMPLDVGVAVKR